MGSCLCKTDDSQLTCPFGSISIKHCGCLGSKKEIDEQTAQINSAVTAQLKAIEIAMKDQMLDAIKLSGSMPEIALSPNLLTRTLSVRFPEPSCPTATVEPGNSGALEHSVDKSEKGADS